MCEKHGRKRHASALDTKRANNEWGGTVNSTRISIAVLLFVTLIMAADSSGATCTNASITGVYGITSVGLNGSLQPASSVDQITVDGAGNLTGSSTKSIDGTIVTYTFTGTYQIAKNCTGTATFTNQNAQTEHDNIVLNNSKRGAFLIQTDNNHVQSSIAVAQGTATCTNLGVKHTYSLGATGIVIGVGQVAAVGQLALNGKGSLTGTATLSLNGSITSSAAVSGTYQINSDCTGTAQVTPQGLSTMNFSAVIVNGGKELMLIETDANTIVSGTLQE
jgi:hypothetical protein